MKIFNNLNKLHLKGDKNNHFYTLKIYFLGGLSMNQKFNVEKLELACDELAIQYLLLYIHTSNLLESYFKENKIEPSFPIDYERFAKWLGIDITYSNLNYFRSSLHSKRLIKIDKNNDGKYLVSIERTATRFEKRYSICIIIASFICDNCERFNTYESTRIPTNKLLLLCEIVASFLLLPPKITFKEIDIRAHSRLSYVQPDLDDLFYVLTMRNELNKIQISAAFQHIKLLAFFLNYEQEKIVQFKDTADIDEITRKQIEDVLNEDWFSTNSFYI